MASLILEYKIHHSLGIYHRRVDNLTVMNSIFAQNWLAVSILNVTGICPYSIAYRRFQAWHDAYVYEFC